MKSRSPMSHQFCIRGIVTLGAVAAALLLGVGGAEACTIFVLTDGTRTLFCNNEDWSDPKTRVWFVPGGVGFYGAVYVGFENGMGQGGMNTAGLAYDAVAGFNDKWEPPPGMKRVRGISCHRMLETCATVDAAVEFYRQHFEPAFAKGRILVADRTGASAIIGAKDGRLYVEISVASRGFGYGARTLQLSLAQEPRPTVENALALLRECKQTGTYATKYSNIFDLRTGSIAIVSADHEPVTLKLTDELGKGGHYYDIPMLAVQVTEPLRPLPPALQRFYLDSFPPIADREPAITARLTRMVNDVLGGTARAEDYGSDLWDEFFPQQEQSRRELLALGEFGGLKLAGRTESDGRRTYRYLVEFERVKWLHIFVLDSENKVVQSTPEAGEPKN